MCWYSTGSPPAAGSKKLVLKLRSVKSIVIPAANTGRLNKSKNDVINTLHANNGIRCNFIPGALILNAVVIKLIDPKRLLNPDTCSEKIARSTDGPGIPISELNGG